MNIMDVVQANETASRLYKQAIDPQAERDDGEILSLLDQAIQILSSVGIEEPLYFYARGEAWFRLGKYEEALKDLEQAYSQNPDLWGLALCLARVLTALKRYEEAIPYYNRAETQDAASPLIAFNKGYALYQTRHYSAAVEMFSRAIELGPSLTTWAYLYRGYAHSLLGMQENALADIRLLGTRINTKLDPIMETGETIQEDHGGAFIAWVCLWVNLPEATPLDRKERLQAISKLDGSSATYVSALCYGLIALLAVVAQKSQRLAIARLFFTRASKLEPDQWDHNFWLGMTAALYDEDEEAMGHIDNALAKGMPPIFLGPLRWLEHWQERFSNYREIVISLP